jgi:citrate lyase subunit beta/citryl-CoA lyase
MTQRPERARRCQLSVPGSSEKMLEKAAASSADHVFCDLEDAVAPNAKVEARAKIVWALNNLNWGRKTRCVRINDVRTEWCHGDVIEILEGAGANVDTIMLTKPYEAADVVFLDRMLLQLEKKLRLDRRIGIEVLIEEVQALQNIDAISTCSDRLECLIFGMGDYSASQGIAARNIGEAGGYPGDIFHYARFRVAMTAKSAGLDPVDGPYGNFKNMDAFRSEAERARDLGMVGKWAIHPSQIEVATEVFTPSEGDILHARRIERAFREAEAQGLGAAQVDGRMIDIASLRYVDGVLRKAALYGL